MEDCRLCGGKLNANGRCTECGLDNSKSDKKYHLNTHNDKGALLHRGDCEDNLNQDNGWGLFIPDKKSRKKRQAVPNRPREKEKSRAAGNQRADGRTYAGGRAAGSQRDAGVPAGSQRDAGQSAGGQTYAGSTRQPDRMYTGTAAGETRSAAAQAKRRKELRERRQTGTVKRKGSCAGSIFWIILIIWCIYYAFSAVRDEASGGWSDIGSVFSEWFSGADEDDGTLWEQDDFEDDPRDGWTWTGL